MLKKFPFALLLILFAVPSISPAWEGKVTGIKDCRTIIVFDGKNLVTVLLEGVDRTKPCPQDAKQFISKSVFGKKVGINDEKKIDGGVAAEVIMADGKSLNKELIRQDLMRSEAQEPPPPAPVLKKTPESPVTPPPAQTKKPAPVQKPAVKKPAKKSPAPDSGYSASPVPGVRKWIDKDGNVHFSGTVGGEE